jgi:MEMO1 family protein
MHIIKDFSMIHYPTVAGMFYPGEAKTLQQQIAHLLTGAFAQANLPLPKAIISPHAGYIYSGPIAASAYSCLGKANEISRLVLLAPSHHEYFSGVATSKFDYYETPLGRISIDQEAVNTVLSLSFVQVLESVYRGEHALEVQLPFLQTVLRNFFLVPFLLGETSPEQVALLLEKVWGGPETLIVVSSDLSHYHEYLTARQLDQKTAEAIIALDDKAISSEQACGSIGIKGLLIVAAKKRLQAKVVDLRNSGDTAGPKDQVVGYGAFHFG